MTQLKKKVKEGQFKIGDEINGLTIESFGKSWTEKEADKDHFNGQLWEECERCDTEPVYTPHHLCERCINRIYGDDTKFCYAYLKENNN